MLILSCRSVYELIGDSNFRDIEEGERREGFFRKWKIFFVLLEGGEKNAGSEDESRKRRVRGETVSGR